MSDALKKSIVDAIEEGQLKLGYREETIRLYYPLSSLCALMHQSVDAAEMTRALATFSEQVKGELGEIEVSRKGERFCLAVGPKGAAWVHEHTDPSGFLADFIAAIGRHGCTMDSAMQAVAAPYRSRRTRCARCSSGIATGCCTARPSGVSSRKRRCSFRRKVTCTAPG